MNTSAEWDLVWAGITCSQDNWNEQAQRFIRRVQADALREAAEIANDQVDLPNHQIPTATIKDIRYFIGIRRGNVNAANAILARAKEIEQP